MTLLVAVLRSARAIGLRGEWRVQRMLRRGLDSSLYVALHNVTLRTIDGNSTQIDHVVVSRFGIFVIETKNLKGCIEGSEHAAQWTQNLHNVSFAFQNPLRQNYHHTQALQNTLAVASEKMHSVIVFVGRGSLADELPANVTQGADCVRFIRSFVEPQWSSIQVQQLVDQLQMKRLSPTRATQRLHLRQLKKRHSAKAQRRCTDCGHPMVLRTARTGIWEGQHFWGCSCYPKCQAVQQININQ